MILTYPTALHYWLHSDGFPSEYYSLDEVSISFPSRLPENIFTLFPAYDPVIRKQPFSLPLHVMLPKASDRRSREGICFHVAPAELPPDSFVRIAGSLYIIRPELCFLLASREMNIPELVLLANNLCSIYKPDVSASYEQSHRAPVTTTDRIADYLIRTKSTAGLNKALRAIRYATDRSNSPIESILAALSRLPLFLGGQAMPEFKMNQDITLSEAAAAFYGKKSCCCDLVWEPQKLIVEYDSTLTHLEKSQHQKDKKRATALMMSGYTVISVTWEQIDTPQKVDLLYSALRHHLGMPNQAYRLEKHAAIRWNTTKTLLYGIKD